MKIEKNTILATLVGLVVGAVGMGLIDASQPEPLFSKASGGACDAATFNLRGLENIQPGTPGAVAAGIDNTPSNYEAWFAAYRRAVGYQNEACGGTGNPIAEPELAN